LQEVVAVDDPIWIEKREAIAIHTRQLAEHGGQDGTRDEGLLESALARPRLKFAYSDPTPSIASLAAAYAFGIARNHPFFDGNKRTAYVVARLFLLLNGHDLTASKDDRYLSMVRMAAGEMTEEQLIAWFEANSRKA
jgi:death-on-curing protein